MQRPEGCDYEDKTPNAYWRDMEKYANYLEQEIRNLETINENLLLGRSNIG